MPIYWRAGTRGGGRQAACAVGATWRPVPSGRTRGRSLADACRRPTALRAVLQAIFPCFAGFPSRIRRLAGERPAVSSSGHRSSSAAERQADDVLVLPLQRAHERAPAPWIAYPPALPCHSPMLHVPVAPARSSSSRKRDLRGRVDLSGGRPSPSSSASPLTTSCVRACQRRSVSLRAAAVGGLAVHRSRRAPRPCRSRAPVSRSRGRCTARALAARSRGPGPPGSP